MRNEFLNHIRSIKTVNLNNVKLIFEELYFDQGLMKKMQQKIAVHTLNGWIPDKERGELMNYCLESDQSHGTQLVASMQAAEKTLVEERVQRDASRSDEGCRRGRREHDRRAQELCW